MARPFWRPDYDKIEMLFCQGYSLKETCDHLKVSRQTMYDHAKYDSRLKKLLDSRLSLKGKVKGVNHYSPLPAMEPVKELQEVWGKMGFDPKILKDAFKAHAVLREVPKDLGGTDQELTDQVREKIFRILHYVTDLDIATAPLKDKVISLKELFGVMRLLEDKPTSILSYEEKKELDELVPQLVAEARRRGLSIEGQYKVVDGGSGDA